MCLTLVIGSIIWFFTLRERADYAKVWQEQSGEVQALLQTSVRRKLRARTIVRLIEPRTDFFEYTAILLWVLECHLGGTDD